MDAKKTFKVRTTDGALRSEHTEQDHADTACAEANHAATELGVKARYEVVDES